MKTATVRDLRNNFAVISSWLENGEEVAITRRGKKLARLVPEKKPKKLKFPDFAARAKKLCGGRMIDTDALWEYNRGNR